MQRATYHMNRSCDRFPWKGKWICPDHVTVHIWHKKQRTTYYQIILTSIRGGKEHEEADILLYIWDDVKYKKHSVFICRARHKSTVLILVETDNMTGWKLIYNSLEFSSTYHTSMNIADIYHLKVHLHEIFHFKLVWPKEPIRAPE